MKNLVTFRFSALMLFLTAMNVDTAMQTKIITSDEELVLACMQDPYPTQLLEIENLILEGAQVNSVYKPLHIPVVILLLSRGADINAPETRRNQRSPLSYARSYEMADFLERKGAQLTAKDLEQ